jgi:hypothetical protein
VPIVNSPDRPAEGFAFAVVQNFLDHMRRCPDPRQYCCRRASNIVVGPLRRCKRVEGLRGR